MNSLIFLALLSFIFVFEMFLFFQNRLYLTSSNHQKAGIGFGFSQEKIDLQIRRNRDLAFSKILGATSSLLLMGAWLISGFLGTLDNWLSSIFSPTLAGTLFLMFLAGSHLLVSIALDAYDTFIVESRYRFNRQTWKTWLKDKILTLSLMIVFSFPIIFFLIKFITTISFSKIWILLLSVQIFLSLLFIWIYPQFIAPIFNRFSPLQDEILKEKLSHLGESTGFSLDRVFIMDASKRSSHGNAYFTGFGKKKKIVIFDNLLRICNHDELIGVLAHELGHFRHKHILFASVLSFLLSGIIWFFLQELSSLQGFYETFSLIPSPHAWIFGVFAWWSILSFPMTFILHLLSHRNEFEADAFAKKMGRNQDLISALKKLSEDSLSVPFHHPLYEIYYHSHPSILRRFEKLGQSS